MKSYFSKSSLGKGLGAFAVAILSGCSAHRLTESAVLPPAPEPEPVVVQLYPPKIEAPAAKTEPPAKLTAIDASKLYAVPPPNILIYNAGPGYVVSVKNANPMFPAQPILPPGTLFYLPDHIPLSSINADPHEDPAIARIIWLVSPTYDDMEEGPGIVAGGRNGVPLPQTSFQSRLLPLTPEQKLLALEKHLSFLRILANPSLSDDAAQAKWRKVLAGSAQRAIIVREVDQMTLRITWENIGEALAPIAARHAVKKWEEVQEQVRACYTPPQPILPAVEKEAVKDNTPPAFWIAPPPVLELPVIFNPPAKER
ncbi:MAG: hypothetical protein AB7G80_04840 [Dongiaceae bacterium]